MEIMKVKRAGADVLEVQLFFGSAKGHECTSTKQNLETISNIVQG